MELPHLRGGILKGSGVFRPHWVLDDLCIDDKIAPLLGAHERHIQGSICLSNYTPAAK